MVIVDGKIGPTQNLSTLKKEKFLKNATQTDIYIKRTIPQGSSIYLPSSGLALPPKPATAIMANPALWFHPPILRRPAINLPDDEGDERNL